MDVATLLRSLGLEDYVDIFIENAIDLETLPLLSDEDLKELGMTALGHRRKLMSAVADGALAPAEEAKAAAVSVEKNAGERRQVTVLFADISGFTQISSQADPEEVHALLNRFFEIVDGIVQSYGGSVDKHIGDCVMAVFGAPVAHSNDPERAARAALEMHRAVGSSDPPIRIHVGLASGQVVASGVGSDAHQEYTITGESVNLASRLQDMAQSRQTLMSDAVYQAIKTTVPCQRVGEIEVDGFEHPVKVWQPVTEHATGTHVARGALIGRLSEIRQFTSAIQHCAETGTGQTIQLRGEAGIGKTHLSEEFAAIASRDGFACHVGRVLDFGVGTGQDAVRSIVRSLLDLPDTGSDEPARREAIERAVAQGLIDPERTIFLNDLLDLAQPMDLRSIYDAMDNENRNRGKMDTLAELTAALSQRTPLLIRIEDVHWADKIVLAPTARLAEAVANCAAILVLTSRIEGDPLDQAWKAAAGGGSILTLELGPLRAEEALQLAGEFMDTNDRFIKSCIERAGGNPLFLEQLLRSAEESSMQEVPGSVQSIVLARMDNLDAPDKQAIQAASVIGQRFALDLLRHLVESPQYTCASLVEHHLLRPEGEEFLFAHALVRDGVYSSLLKAKRRELHLRAADWYADSDLTLRAEHLGRAEDARAAGAYADAAEADAALFRFEKALGLARHGQDLAHDAATKHRLTMLEGEYLRDTGQPAESIEVYRRAVELAEDDIARCRALIGLSAGMRVTDDYQEALDALDQAEGVASSNNLDAELSDIHYYRGNLYFPLGKIHDCLAEHEKALEAAQRAASPEHEVRAMSGLADAYYSQGLLRKGLEHFRRCIELSQEHGYGRIAVGNKYMVAWIKVYLNDLTDARTDAQEAVEAAKQVGHRRAEMVARLTAGRVLTDLAEFDAAQEHIERGLELAEQLGASRFKPFLMIFLAQVQFYQKQPRGPIVKMMQEALAISRDTGIGFLGPWVLGTIALVSDDEETSRAALAEAEEILAGDCVGHNYFGFYPFAMEVALRLGAWDEAERYAKALEDYTKPESLPWTEFFASRCRVLAAYGRGERDETTVRELERVRDEAGRAGTLNHMPALEVALSAV